MTIADLPPTAPMRRSFPRWLIVVIIGGVLVLGFCAIVGIGALTLLGQKVAPTVIQSDDGNSQVSVPETWKKLSSLNEAADLQAGYPAQHQYLIVLTENKADLAVTNLEAYTTVVLRKLTGNIKAPQVSAPRNLTINGRSAIQYEVRGTVKNANIVYWLTSVDGVKHYHQVLAWTLVSQAEQSRPVLQGAIESFRETDK